jgi:hypothetical protein
VQGRYSTLSHTAYAWHPGQLMQYEIIYEGVAREAGDPGRLCIMKCYAI